MLPQQILLIEDDPDIQRMVTLTLQYTAGAKVSVAGDGAAGMAAARAQQPGLILLDVMLPDMDGYQICKALKTDPATSSIPVVFLSARAQQMEIQHGISLGAVGYVVKPFDPMLLAQELDRILSAAGHTGGASQ